jgi:hypothetical protein
MQNDFTTAIRKEDVRKVIELSGCTFEELDISSLEAPAGSEPVAKAAKPVQEKKAAP